MTDSRKMFYGAKPQIFAKAKELRENLTKAENELWNKLRANQLLGLRFKSQHPIQNYIADFYCHKLKLVIEVDGGYHEPKDQGEYDLGRTYDLNDLGIQVIRFSNEEVLSSIENVIKKIYMTCENKLKSDEPKSPLGDLGEKDVNDE